jgi:uncharacterized protein YchJ
VSLTSNPACHATQQRGDIMGKFVEEVKLSVENHFDDDDLRSICLNYVTDFQHGDIRKLKGNYYTFTKIDNTHYKVEDNHTVFQFTINRI